MCPKKGAIFWEIGEVCIDSFVTDFIRFAQQHGHDVLAKLQRIGETQVNSRKAFRGRLFGRNPKKIEDTECSTAKRKSWTTIEIVVRIIIIKSPGGSRHA